MLIPPTKIFFYLYRFILKKYTYILFTVLCLLLVSFKSEGQCNLTYTPTNCLQVGAVITFNNISAGGGVIEDPNGYSIGIVPPQLYPLNFNGTYTVTGWFGGACNYTIEVVDQPINLSLSTNSTTVCINGSIDYSSLGINITNDIGNVTYYWELPNGQNWTGLTPFPIPTGQNNVTLTITDNATGCSDSETISLSYHTTNANASFVPSTNTITCPGQSVTFTANNINTSLYSYSWEVDGSVVSGGSNGILNTNIYPNGNNVDVTLIVTDTNGCFDTDPQTFNSTIPNYVALDTSGTNFNSQTDYFYYCFQTDSLIVVTLFNLFTNTTGIDSVIIYNGFTQEIYTSIQGFDEFYVNISESVYNITVTTIHSGGCPPTTITYDVLYTKILNFTTSWSQQINNNICKNDTVNYLIDPQIFQMPLNAKINFYIICDNSNTDTIIWNSDSVINNTDLFDHDNDSLTPKINYIVFKYLFDTTSCGCVWSNGQSLVYDKYRIWPIITTSCGDTLSNTLGEETYIPPDPTAYFEVPDSMCPGATATIINESDFGCQNSLNPSYQPGNYNLVSPTFYYDWGNCSRSTYTPTQSQYQSNNFISASNTHTYNNPGIYHVELSAINSCDTATFDTTITIFPKPEVFFTADSVCLDLITPFTSIANAASATQDIIPCFPNNIIIDVPAGLPLVPSNLHNNTVYQWDIQGGSYVNGTSDTSQHPQYIFNDCGNHIVSLTVTDSLGCDSTYTDTVIVYELPHPNFSTEDVCEGNPTCIEDLSDFNTDNNCFGHSLSSWQWDILDENSQNVYTNTDNSSIDFCDTLTPPCDSSNVSFDYEIILTLTDSYGCVDNLSQTTTVFCQPIAEFDSSGVCFDSPDGATKYFNNNSEPQSGMSWSWDMGDGNNTFYQYSTTMSSKNPIYTFADTGTYIVTLYLFGPNCDDSVVHLVEVWDNPIVSHIDTNILCFGDNTGSINIDVTGGTQPYIFNWTSNNGFTSSDADINSLFTGTYYLEITDSNECTLYDTIELDEPDQLNFTTTTTDVTCFGGSDGSATVNIISGGNPPFSFLWNSGHTTATASGLSAGTYTCTITYNSICDTNVTITIDEPNIIDTTVADTACGNYLWVGTNYTSTGIHIRTLTSVDGCDSIVTLNLTILNTITVTDPCIANNIVCQTSPGAASAFDPLTTIATGGVGTWTYQWYELTTGIITGATSPTYIPPSDVLGTFQYYCIVEQNPISANCWVSTDTCTVIVTSGPTVVTPFQDDSVCINASVNPLTVTPGANGGTPTYQWFVNGIAISAANGGITATYTPPTNVSGTFVYYCTLTFPLGACDPVDSDSITIVVMPDPAIDIQPLAHDTICEGGIINIPLEITDSIGTGVGIDTYQWYDLNGPIIGETNSTFTPSTSGLAVGSYFYFAVLSFDGNGCDSVISDTAHIEIIGDPISNFNLLYDSLCVNHTQNPVWTNLSSGANITTYLWEITDINGAIHWYNLLTTNVPPTFPTLTQGVGPITYYISLTVSNACANSTYIDSIVILPAPQVFFITTPNCPNICLPIASPLVLYFNNFVDTLNTDSVVIRWGDGTNSGIISPNLSGIGQIWNDLTHIYSSIGTFDICITGYNECDSTTYCCQVITVPNQINSGFQVLDSTNNTCLGEEVCFVELSSQGFPNANVNWWFDYNPNQIPNYPFLSAPDASVIFTPFDTICWEYSAPGAYLVLHEITVLPSNGCGPFVDTTVNWLDTVFVYPEPEVLFSCDTGVCLFETITIINNTTLDNTLTNMPNQQYGNYQWYIDGVPVSSPWDLTYTPQTSGNIWIKFETWSNYGCYDVDSCEITVFDLPTAGFTVIPDSSCFGLDSTRFIANIPTNSQNGSGNIINWTWNFDGSLEGPFTSDSRNHLFGSPGNHPVSLTILDDNGCYDIFIDTINLIPGNTASFSWDTVCFGNSTPFDGSLSSVGTSLWEWDFDNDGYVDDYGVTSNFTFPSNGTYPVTLTTYKYLANDTCSNTTTINVYVWDLPNVNYIVADSCLGDMSQFINLSNPGIDAPLLSSPYNWIFHDIPYAYSTDINPQHTFVNCGIDSTKLIVTDVNGCRDSITLPVVIACPPTANFVWDTMVCDGTEMCLTNISNDGNYPVNQWNWDINGGSYQVSNQYSENPCYLFDSCGSNKPVELIVTDDLGCFDDTTIYVDVHCNPEARINNINLVCQGDSTYFTNSSIPRDVPLMSLWWDFGDLNGSADSSTSNLYDMCNDNYIVTLYVTDENYCTDVDSSIATVNCNPVAGFTYDEKCEGTSTPFDAYNSSSPNYQYNSNINIINWYWNFGSLTSPDSVTSHLFNGCGTELLPVSLTITDNQTPNCSSTITDSITVNCNPIARISTDTVCQNIPTTLTSMSLSGGTDSLFSCTWNITGGNPAAGNFPNMCITQYDFNNCGQQQNYVYLTVENTALCMSTDSIKPYVFCNPYADFSVSNVRCEDTPIQFTNLSNGVPVSVSIDSLSWNFGTNAIPTNSNNPIETVVYPTLFNPHIVTLTVWDDNKCTDTLIKSIVIHPNPTANFYATKVCHGQPTEFTDMTIPGDTGILNYFWTFIDTPNSFDGAQNPTHKYLFPPSNEGAYVEAILIVEDSFYCRDTTEILTSEVHPIPEIEFTSPDICEGLDSIFVNTSVVPGINWVFSDGPLYGDPVWIFNGDYFDLSPDTFSFINTYPPNIYTLSLTIETTFISEYDTNHCSHTHDTLVEILVMPKINPDTSWTNLQCGTDVEFTFEANPANVHDWFYYIDDIYSSNNPISTTHNFTYLFDFPGIYPFKQYIWNDNKCGNTIIDSLHIYPNPIAIFIPSVEEGCEELDVDFINNSFIQYDSLYDNGSSSIITYYWYFDDGDESLDSIPTHSYNADNGSDINYIPSLYVETNHGCYDSISFPNGITVHPSPTAIISDPPIPEGSGSYIFDGTQSELRTIPPRQPHIDSFQYIWEIDDLLGYYDVIEDYEFDPNEDSTLYQYTSFPDPDGHDFWVYLTVTDGLCSHTDSIQQNVIYWKKLNVPNSIAPSSIGETSYFLPKGKSIKTNTIDICGNCQTNATDNYRMQIFDKFGNLLWESTEVDSDGKPSLEGAWRGEDMKGTPLPQGTYIWKIHAVFSDCECWEGMQYPGTSKKVKTGAIYLIR